MRVIDANVERLVQSGVCSVIMVVKRRVGCVRWGLGAGRSHIFGTVDSAFNAKFLVIAQRGRPLTIIYSVSSTVRLVGK